MITQPPNESSFDDGQKPRKSWVDWCMSVFRDFKYKGSGPTSSRPVNGLSIGDWFFDTTFNRPVFVINISPVTWADQGSAKAWVKFNGTGTVAILSSYNVSSITDNGVGDYTVNFTTAFSSVNYSWALACGNENATAFRCGVGPTAAPTASSFRFITVDGALVPADFTHVSATFFGDQ